MRDVLISALRDGSLKIYGWRNPGKVWKIDSVQAYFNCSMDLLKPDIRKELFSTERPVWGKQRDDMPTRHAPGAVVKNSIIADGCIIEGKVEKWTDWEDGTVEVFIDGKSYYTHAENVILISE